MERFGISAALLTPFSEDGSIDLALFTDHAVDILQRGASSVTIFGTTGEGAWVRANERQSVLGHLISAGVPRKKIIQTIYATAVDDAVAQFEKTLELGVDTVLLVPPFYFKDCSDDGLFGWYEQVFERTDPSVTFVLYHIPQVTGVPLPVSLIERLAAGFQARIRAIKDSSGDWENASELLAMGSVPVLVGDERLLHRALAQGGAGAVTGMANLHPERMRQVFETEAEDVELSAYVAQIVKHPVIPALKAVLADQSGNPDWTRTRAPLTTIDSEACAELQVFRL